MADKKPTRRSTKGKQQGRYNWVELRKEYEASGMTQQDFADKYGIPYGTLRNRIYTDGGWTQSKKAAEKRAVEKAREQAVNRASVELATAFSKSNNKDVNAADRITAKALAFLELVERASDIAAIATAIEKAQKIRRLALGMTTDKHEHEVLSFDDMTTPAQRLRAAQEFVASMRDKASDKARDKNSDNVTCVTTEYDSV